MYRLKISVKLKVNSISGDDMAYKVYQEQPTIWQRILGRGLMYRQRMLLNVGEIHGSNRCG